MGNRAKVFNYKAEYRLLRKIAVSHLVAGCPIPSDILEKLRRVLVNLAEEQEKSHG